VEYKRYMGIQKADVYYDSFWEKKLDVMGSLIFSIKGDSFQPEKYGFNIEKEDYVICAVSTFKRLEIDESVSKFATLANLYEINYKF